MVTVEHSDVFRKKLETKWKRLEELLKPKARSTSGGKDT